MTVYRIDPLTDARWFEFVSLHPQASIFHTPGWLEALHRTYGYTPVAFTTSPPESALRNGLVCCLVSNWLTGQRLVSLPFSDHCQPLVDNASDMESILTFISDGRKREHWKYIELRPLCTPGGERLQAQFKESSAFNIHWVDLRPDLQTLYGRFHDSCVRRKIRKADREKLTYEAGRSEPLLNTFFDLFLLTRRRHRMPPQPIAWFRNLIECLGDTLTIRIAYKDKTPIAGIVTLLYRDTLMYKYGCSDAEYHRLGGMPFLFWKAIQDGKAQGAVEFDLGRSSLEGAGLAEFKEHLGAARSTLTYYRYPAEPVRSADRLENPFLRHVLALLPDSMFTAAGSVFYRYMG